MAFSRYFQPRLLAVFFLGISSGLPLALVVGTLSARLTESGIDKATIGLFAWVSYPYVFKFVWAPLMDRLPPLPMMRRLGHRRGWMLTAQLCLLLAILGLAQVNPAEAPELTALFALLVAFCSASQDVVIDAYRAEILSKEDYGDGVALAVFGYRVGMLISGAGALTLATVLPWETVYTLMALAVSIGVVTVLLAPEPEALRHLGTEKNVAEWVRSAVISPFAQFMRAHKRWPLLLLFVAIYHASDGFVGFMSTPFLLDVGFKKDEIALVAKLYGFGAAIAGSFAGAYLVRRIGLWNTLLLAGAAQMVTKLGYLLITDIGAELWALTLAISLDNFTGGAETAAGVVLLMRLCHVDFTATQYALLSSLAGLARISMAGFAGFVAAEHGWAAMYITGAALGLPSLLVLFSLRGHAAFAQNSVEKTQEKDNIAP